MISSGFPGTPTAAMEILLNKTPIEKFLLAEEVRGLYKIIVSGLWHVNPVVSFGKTKSHVDVCNEPRRFLPVCWPNKENNDIREKFRMSNYE